MDRLLLLETLMLGGSWAAGGVRAPFTLSSEAVSIHVPDYFGISKSGGGAGEP